MTSILLKQGLVLGPDGVAEADVLVVDGIVAEVGASLEDGDARVVDCSGAWVGPGFVDLHTHLREPGEEWKEDIASGSAAAAAGGYTAIVAMPNTDPPIDSGHVARYVADRGRSVGLVDVVPAGCVSMGRRGSQMSHLDELWTAGVRIFTDDGDAVMDAGLVRRAMEYLAEIGGVFAQHAEDAGLVSGGFMHEGVVSSRLGLPGRPAEAEETIIARDLSLVRLTGCRYHVLHVTTAGAVELVRAAKAEGLPVTAEVTPHHLFFDHRDLENVDPAFKMHPPLRTEEDVAALRAAVSDGTIDAVATDHAPHAVYEKETMFEEAPAGVIGLETAAAVLQTTIDPGPERFFASLSGGPATIAGLADHGSPLAPGRPANLVVFDPEQSWTPQHWVSSAENSPFRGVELAGRVRTTMFAGTLTYDGGSILPGTRVGAPLPR